MFDFMGQNWIWTENWKIRQEGLFDYKWGFMRATTNYRSITDSVLQPAIGYVFKNYIKSAVWTLSPSSGSDRNNHTYDAMGSNILLAALVRRPY